MFMQIYMQICACTCMCICMCKFLNVFSRLPLPNLPCTILCCQDWVLEVEEEGYGFTQYPMVILFQKLPHWPRGTLHFLSLLQAFSPSSEHAIIFCQDHMTLCPSFLLRYQRSLFCYLCHCLVSVTWPQSEYSLLVSVALHSCSRQEHLKW